MNRTPRLLALDGHDASGKTTLSRRIASALGGVPVRPFSGAVGTSLLEAAEAGRTQEVWRVGVTAVGEAIERHRSEPLIVMDRCWMTVFTLVPEDLHNQWPFKVPTVLCAASLATTLARLELRSEVECHSSWHERYLAHYLDLAKHWNVPVVWTDIETEDASLARLLSWAQTTLGRPSEGAPCRDDPAEGTRA